MNHLCTRPRPVVAPGSVSPRHGRHGRGGGRSTPPSLPQLVHTTVLTCLLTLRRLVRPVRGCATSIRFPALRPARPLTADGGMTTAEYAVGTVAACGFAALLYKVVTSPSVSSALTGLVKRALDVAG